jgi:arylsulfatase A-like enzyme/cytochrome c-type biogenesis protein CcmH/NrfG
MRLCRFFFFCCLVTAAWAGPVPDKAQPPDVFLVTIDTLRADHIHCYGYEKIDTPALDGLAKDGIRFEQAFTPSPITNSSHATILTGLLPSDHGVTDFGAPLSSDHPTWAELLKPRGYHAAAFIGAVILDSKSLAPGFDRGFDFYDNFPEHVTTKSRWGRVERRGMEVVQHAENWLDAHRSSPHFVWVHLYDPHDPYEPPEPFASLYKERLYDGEIAYADSALGHFVAYLKKQGWYDGAVIIVVGDHGEGLGEHNEDTHGIFLYDSTTHVPLMVKLPGQETKGREVAGQVRTTDILPTVLDLVGAQPPARLDGESLRPYFAGGETSGRTAFGETDYPLHFGWAPLRSVRDGGVKFIEAPRPELYDLHSDPGEIHNAYESADANVQRLRGMLAELRKKMPEQASRGAVGQVTSDELRALGYVGPVDASSPSNGPAATPLPDPKDKIEEQNLLHKAMLAIDDERTDAALGALKKVLEMDPKSATALGQLGQLELTAKNYAAAADYLGRAREVRPEDATTAFSYGEALQMTGNLPGACDALQAGLKVNPNQFSARLLLGKVYLAMKDMPAAEDQFEAALLLQPGSVDAQLGLAEVLIARRRFGEAIPQLLAITRSQPRNAEVYAFLARAYSGLGKKEEAMAAERRAKALETQQNPN